MKTTMKKIITMLLTVAMLLSMTTVFAGCGKSNMPEDINEFLEEPDAARTQLYIGYFNGGLGMAWLKEVKRLYEELHPDVQIMIDGGKDEFTSGVLLSNIKTNRQDMYLIDGLDYLKFIKEGGLLADLTEATTTPLTEYGEDKSIADKMNESLRQFYETGDGKYYAAPFYQSYHHIIYDVDLFDQYSLWYKDGGGFVSSTADKKSAGQDGEYGTWDDGLPVTYSEFFALMDRMVGRGITPMTWSGQYADEYLTNFTISLIANHDGENFQTLFNYDGEVTYLANRDFTESDAKTFTVNEADWATVTVTPDNYQDYVHSTQGKYFATKWAKDVASNPQYRTYNYAESHTAVQRSFLTSNMEGVDEPIAMLIEGGWWMNEATSVFDEMKVYDEKYSKENRRFGVMPFPKADDGSSAEGNVVSPFSGQSAVFISERSPNKDLAIDFYRFMHTDICLQACVEYSGVLRPYDCDLSAVYDKVPYYVQNVIDASKDTTYIYRVTTDGYFEDNADALSFMCYGGMQSGKVGGAASSNLLIFFCDNGSASAKDFFLSMKDVFINAIPASMKQ